METDLERSEFFGLWKIKDASPTHNALRAYVQKTWETPDASRFPGPQPVSIERCHFPLLKKQPYLVCEKTDGVRLMLVCFEHGGKKFCALLNRAFEAHIVSLTIPRDTVLDGELVQQKTGRWLYLVYDAIYIKGEDVRLKSLDLRLAMATKTTRLIIKSAKDPFEVKTKMMFPLAKISEMPPLDAFPYETDGVVFTPVNEPVRMGTHETMFKWKPRDRITIDFYFRDNILHIQDRGNFLRVATMYPPGTYPPGTIVECGYGEKGWYAVKVRTDKTHPNNKRTYHRTIVNLRENILFVELMKCI